MRKNKRNAWSSTYCGCCHTRDVGMSI
jgi:hypothetical protein